MLNEISHASRCPILPSKYPPNNFSFTVNEESFGMALDSIRIGYLRSFVDQKGRCDIEFTLIFFYILFLIFNGHFKKDDVLFFKLFVKFNKRRRLLPTAWSPGGKKV